MIRRFAPVPLFMLLAAALMSGGCRSHRGPGADHLAAVVIEGSSVLQVARAASDVFQAAGFVAVPLARNDELQLMFERQAGTGAILAYGDWSGTPIWYRARLSMSSLGPGGLLLTCDVYRVAHRGDPHFEEEDKVTRVHRRTYQALLQKIKARVNAGGTHS